MVYCTLDAFPKGKCCKFCKLRTVNELMLGSIYQTGDIIVHYFCLLLASKGIQRGTDRQGLLGFLAKDIKNEVLRGSRIQCVYCKKKGATVICANRNCKSNFHLPCGLKNNSLHLFYNSFESLCVKHRPKVFIPRNILSKIVENNETCIICFTRVNTKNNHNLIWPPCCEPSSILHKKCVQEMAFGAGYYFKCPLCADVEIFKSKMQQSGIYVPMQEASWEREPHAFSDFNVSLECESKSCAAPQGPVYHKKGTKWQLENCNICGSKAIHLACSGKWKPNTKFYLEWECTDCAQIMREITYSKHENQNNEIVSRFSLIGNIHTFLSYPPWKDCNSFQNKLKS